jgi:membrane-associated phospholipid phosphatase
MDQPRKGCVTEYPVQFSVDYPDRPLDRLSTAFRIFLVIPIVIVLGAVSGGTWEWSYPNGTTAVAAGAGGLLFFGPLLMILFRQKYPVVVRLEP